MAPHRKARSSGSQGISKGIRTPALATAALTSVALLSQTAEAAPVTEPTPAAEPTPSMEEVQKKVEDLYQQAGTATEKYDAAREKTTRQRKRVGTLLDDVARRTENPNSARGALGAFAPAQYRTGASAPDQASPLLADDPRGYFDRTRLMNRLTVRQKQAADEYVTQRAATTDERQETSEGPETPTATQNTLRSSKQDVQRKLAAARDLLSARTAGEKTRLAAIQQETPQEALRTANGPARQQAAGPERRRPEAAAQPRRGTGAATGSGSTGTGMGAGIVPGTDSAATAKAAKALAFARAQIGKPYVWGASGPGSYDCSGLTLAAWKAAGVTLPRTAWDQAKSGTTVSVDHTQPGDLVFFYDDISHVGICSGDGMMIHAPRPGAYVREESIYCMPIHSVVRTA